MGLGIRIWVWWMGGDFLQGSEGSGLSITFVGSRVVGMSGYGSVRSAA